MEKIEISLHIE